MDVRTVIEYPTATPDQVFALLVDRDFRSAVCVATHALEYDVDITHHDDGHVSVTVERTLPAEVPDFVKRFVGRTLSIVQSERWGPHPSAGGRTADLLIQIKGQPATMKGSLRLEASGEGTREQVSGELTVSVPFVGKKIEPEVAKAIVAAAAQEQATGRAWLRGS